MVSKSLREWLRVLEQDGVLKHVGSLQIKSQAPSRTWRKKILQITDRTKGQHKKATAERWLKIKLR